MAGRESAQWWASLQDPERSQGLVISISSLLNHSVIPGVRRLFLNSKQHSDCSSHLLDRDTHAQVSLLQMNKYPSSTP